MKSNEEISFLKNTLSEDELKAYCKGAIFIANKEDRQDDVVNYSNTFNDTVNQIPQVKQTSIDADTVKQAMSKISDKDMSVDNVIGEINPSQMNNQDLRNLVQSVINSK